jgi:hypothetical protein
MWETLQNIVPLPFTSDTYGMTVLQNQISLEMLFWGHIGPALITIAFSYFIWRHTKKLSAFYLFLASLALAAWSYCDLVTWSADGPHLMFTWSIMDLLNVLFFIFSLWFLYVFITQKDVPTSLKVVSLAPILFVAYYTVASIHLHTYFRSAIIALENDTMALGFMLSQVLVMAIITIYLIVIYIQTSDRALRLRILLGGLGVMISLSVFSFSFLITNTLLYFSIGSAGEAYNMSVYSLFGMPLLVAFLGYLIAKYQAFDLKLTRSIGYIVILMGLLFVSIFI